MKKLFVLGIVAAMVFGFAAMAGAYAVSIAVTAGPIATSANYAQVDFGDYQNGVSNDEFYYAPTSSSYLEATTTSLYNATQVSGTFGAAAQTAQDFNVWTVGTVTTPIYLYATLVDDGTNVTDGAGGSWGGSATPLTDNWQVMDVTTDTVVANFTFSGDDPADTAIAKYGATNVALVGAITPGTAASGAGSVEYSIQQVPVPEPGSMVALFSGIVGLVGFGIRRRK